MSDIVRDPYGNPLNRDKLITALRAEVERLKAVENDYDDHEREMIDLEEDNTRLVAENKRLRAALQAVDDEHGYGLPPDTRKMIRAALEEKQ